MWSVGQHVRVKEDALTDDYAELRGKDATVVEVLRDRGPKAPLPVVIRFDVAHLVGGFLVQDFNVEDGELEQYGTD